MGVMDICQFKKNNMKSRLNFLSRYALYVVFAAIVAIIFTMIKYYRDVRESPELQRAKWLMDSLQYEYELLECRKDTSQMVFKEIEVVVERLKLSRDTVFMVQPKTDSAELINSVRVIRNEYLNYK